VLLGGVSVSAEPTIRASVPSNSHACREELEVRQIPGTDALFPNDQRLAAFGPVRSSGRGRDQFLSDLHRSARNIAAGTELSIEGDEVHSVTWVLSGWISLNKMMDDGRQQIIDFIYPFDVIFPAGADGTTACCSMTAVTNAIVASYSNSELRRQKEEFEELSAILERLHWAQMARWGERMLRLGRGTAHERIAYALLELYTRLQSSPASNAQKFSLPITQNDLGEFTGMTSIHVCRIIRDLRNDGIIENGGQEILIRDLVKLEAIANISLHRLRKEILPFGVFH